MKIKRWLSLWLALALLLSLAPLAALAETGDGQEDPAGYSDPSDPTDPADPTDPTDPSDPTDPTDPSDPTDPTDPTDPSDPTDPADPSDPTDPADPTDPGDPADPGDPTDPADPGALLLSTAESASEDGGETYTVFIYNGGFGGGDYAPGDTVTIRAYEYDGFVFTQWDGLDGVTFTEGSTTTPTATFLMPAYNLILKSSYGWAPTSPKYTVVLDPGAGSGTPLTYDTENTKVGLDPSGEYVFFYKDGAMGFELEPNHCPGGFTAPGGGTFVFDGWDCDLREYVVENHYYYHAYIFPSGSYTVTIKAKWKDVSTIGGIPWADGGIVYLGGKPWSILGETQSKWLLFSRDSLESCAYSQSINKCVELFNGFDSREQSAVIPTTKTEPGSYTIEGKTWAGNDLSNARLFLLSAAELSYYVGSSRTPGDWWLRSSAKTDSDQRGLIDGSGQLTTDANGAAKHGVRPALQFNRGKVFFTSSETGGKTNAADGAFGVLRTVGEKKLTLLDSGRSLTASLDSDEVYPGKTIQITYSGAPTGENEYVSALLTVEDKVYLYYATTPSQGSGIWDLTLPDDPDVGHGMLQLFSEEQNGDFNTDYASNPVYVPLSEKRFRVTFRQDGTDLQTDYVLGGSTPEYRGDTPTRASQDPRIEYVFSGWEPALGPVYEDTVYEAQFSVQGLYQVSFDPNGGSGTMAPQYYYVDMGTFRLPACAFTAPSGCAFQDWILETGGASSGDPVTVRNYNAGTILTGISGDITVKANWVESNVVVGAYPREGGTAVYDSTSGTFTAYPAAGYRFHHWEYVENEYAMTPENPDWPTDNPYAPTPVLNGIYTACFKRPNFRTHALLLSGQIGVYFYMDLSMLSGAEKQASYMEFTVSGKTSTDAFDAACTNPNGDGYYGFTCFINSIQMADTITAVFHYGDGETVSETYSAKEYVDYVLGHTNRYSANTVALVKAIADYGHYVQPFLAGANGWAVGTDHATMDNVNTYGDTDVAAAQEAVANSAIVRDVGDTGIEAVTYSLNLETETSIRIYLKVKEGYTGTVAASLSGSDLTCVRLSDGRYRVEIGGISAHKLADVYEVAVTAGGSFTIRVSALSYVNTVLNSDSALFNNDTARYAVTSLYRYYLATRTYQQNPND